MCICLGQRVAPSCAYFLEIAEGYYSKSASPRCLMKIDLKREYESLQWDFIVLLLYGLHFPKKMVAHIMTYVKPGTYSLCFNGEVHEFFHGGSRVREGDPMSPFLFVFAMEYLSRLLKIMSSNWVFHFTLNAKICRYVIWSSADDLMLFCKADYAFTHSFTEVLNEFAVASTAHINKDKSQVILGAEAVQGWIK